MASSDLTPESLKRVLRDVIGADIMAGLERKPATTLPDGPRTALEGLARHLSLLMKWNARMNLTGARGWREAARDLVADSLLLEGFLRRLQARHLLPDHPLTWDVGAGAGMPGIPLRLVWPCGEFRLVEVREKRAVFLAAVLAEIGLERTSVLRGRAENLLAAEPRRADVILSRAFLPWRDMLEFASPHLARNGALILMSGTDDGIGTDGCGLPAPWRQMDVMEYVVARGRRRFRALACGPRESCELREAREART